MYAYGIPNILTRIYLVARKYSGYKYKYSKCTVYLILVYMTCPLTVYFERQIDSWLISSQHLKHDIHPSDTAKGY